MPAPNSFVWYELMTTDLDAAEAFYRAVVGWGAEDSGQPDMRYTIMSAGDKMVAGLMMIPPEVSQAGGPPAWLGYIGTPDVDAATASVRRAGGAVRRPPDDIPGIGRFSVVADPQGAVFMLFTPDGGDPSPAAPGTPGHVGWHELYANDWKTAFDFYAAQFAWTKDQVIDMGEMGIYQIFAAGGPAIGGMMNKPDMVPAPAWLFYFNVDSADAALARITRNGGRVLMGPMEVPGGSWIIQAMDPQGAIFAVVAPRR